MTRSSSVCLLMLATLPLMSAAADGPREGKWEYTTEMEMAGMPAMPKLPEGVQMPPGMQMPKMGAHGMTQNFTHCLKKDDLVPRADRGHEHCTTTKMEHKGNTVNWSATCETPHGKMLGEGSATYSGDRMESTMHMTGKDDQGHPIDMTQHTTGHYLGACS